MPGFDGTGPDAKGPLTGGGRGYCAVPASTARSRFSGFSGLGCGLGCGRGRGHRRWFNAAGFPGWRRTGADADESQDSVEGLKARASILENEARLVNERIKALEKKAKK